MAMGDYSFPLFSPLSREGWISREGEAVPARNVGLGCLADAFPVVIHGRHEGCTLSPHSGSPWASR